MRLLLVCGNSQVGKSSFVNAISQCHKAEVGTGGQSKTRDVTFHHSGRSKLFFESDSSSSDLYIIDIPGFQDTDMAISDEEICRIIYDQLFEMNKDSLDGIIIIDSANSSSISILPTIYRLMQILGPNIISSLIVVTTKWDRLNKEEVQARIEGYKRIKNIDMIRWINDSKAFEVDETTKTLQFKELSIGLMKLSPFKINQIKDLEKILKARAEKIQSNTPEKERYNISKVIHKVTKPIKKTISEPYDAYEDAYPDEQSLRARAEQLKIEAGTYKMQRSRIVSKLQTEEYFDIQVSFETRKLKFRNSFLFIPYDDYKEYRHRIETPIKRYRQVTRNVIEYYTTEEYYDIANFIEIAKKEKKKVIKYKNIVVDDFEIVDKEEIIKTEKHQFEYYLNLAKKEMMEEFRDLCRNIISLN